MSILKKPYEVAVYDDILIDGIFQEKRLGIIGSDKMMSQNRVLEPNLVRNVNGQNKFSFKMYKHYTDTITGEKIYNPFVDWVISERKVKLKYEDKWYDFIVKDISENSADYLYTYQLEDANVQELSKNGFGITLDADLMNNIGDSVSLGRQVMAETDWQVDGDVIVEQVDEALVYLTVPESGVSATLLKDTNENYSSAGLEEVPGRSIPGGSTVLGFYSSCTNKPHRFQFIYREKPEGETGAYNKIISEDGKVFYNIDRKDDRIINEKDCQYYVDFITPEADYKNDEADEESKKRKKPEKEYGVYLPNGWSLAVPAAVEDQRVPAIETQSDSQVSSWYRGKRYGFAHQSVYVPVLERYCQKYIKSGTDYLGYIDTTYVSPTTVQNYISGYNFESTSGWTATSNVAKSGNKRPEIANFYGRYNEGFVSITDDFLNGSYNESNTYTPYMKMTFYGNDQYILNSCVRDNRTLIENLSVGQELVLDYNIKNSRNRNASGFTFQLGEYIYNTTTGGYNQRTSNIKFDTEIISNGRIIFKVKSSNYNEKTFKKDSKIYLKIIPPSVTDFEEGTSYYIEKIALYKKCLDKQGNIIIPDYEAEESNAVQNWIDTCNLQKEYKLFPAWSVDNDNPDRIIEKDSLTYDAITTFDYNTYKPVYNIGGTKVRTVTAKESNYFNILQTIAETFEQWLVINIDRNDDGSIKPNGKKISFKNYRGNNNYACFRYGVNLKDIQRTKSSKNIVTKLIVKQNANELAEDGFCTIQRAGSNPTGENYLYDFQYYHNTGIMDPSEYLTTNYYLDGAIGEDINEEDTTTNLNGYFIRLKQLNNDILPLNQEIIGLQSDLVSEKAKLEVAKNTIEAATQSIEITREDFRALVGLYPEEIQEDDIASITVSSKKEGDEENYNPIRPQQDWFSANAEAIPNENRFKVITNVINNRIISLNPGTEDFLNGSIDMGKYYRIVKKPKQSGPMSSGLRLNAAYTKNGKYKIEYVIEITEKHAGKLTNIGLHSSPWKQINFKVTNSNGIAIGTFTGVDRINFNTGLTQGTYLVEMEAFFVPSEEEVYPHFYIQPNKNINVTEDTEVCIIKDISLKQTNGSGVSSVDRTAYTYVDIDVSTTQGSTVRRTFSVPCKIAADAASGEAQQDVTPVDNTRSDVQKYITEYTTYKEQLERANKEKNTIEPIITQKENTKKAQEAIRKKKLEQKTKLNQLFFQRYSRFIQEGTWIDEEYVDDEKYFADAQSVLYNSCYPQVAYNINVLELSQLPGYELFKFELGDKTWAIDDEFFGEGVREEVIITELNENLDDPSKNQIKVQNFKNQFQDLFQKITATVQQTQYNSGSYEKGNALLEASAAKRNEFVTSAINDAASFLAPGKTHDVVWDESGITVTETGAPCNQVRIVGGAILLSAEDPKTHEQTWMTGLTNQGISANLITAGRLNTGEIQIMSGDDATFKWDAYGLSAYDATWYDDLATGVQTISGIDTKKFVRFDKNGIYGINNVDGIDGKTWHPTGIGDKYKDKENPIASEIDDKATFALTWEGLKVTGSNNGSARLGKQDDGIMVVRDENGQPTFRINNNGTVEIAGNLKIGGTLQDGISISEIAESVSNKNLLLNSAPLYVRDWNDTKTWSNISNETKIGSNADGTEYSRIIDIISSDTDSREYFRQDQNCIYIKAEGQKKNSNNQFLWNGTVGQLDYDDNIINANEYITISFQCKISKLDSSDIAGVTNRVGCAVKGIADDGLTRSWDAVVEESDANIGKGWFDVKYTFKASLKVTDCYAYIYIAQNGEAWFRNIKIERGQRATTWAPNSKDWFNQGANLYVGPSEINPKTSNNNYDSDYLFCDLVGNNYIPPLENDKPYYFSAKVTPDSNTVIDKITVAVYNKYEKNGSNWYKEYIIKDYPIINHRISGQLPIARYINGYNTQYLLIYSGLSGSTKGNNVTFSEIKIQKGTESSDITTFPQWTNNNNYSWDFSPYNGISMWNGSQNDNNLVFKIGKQIINGKEDSVLFMRGNGEFTGTIIATGGKIGTVFIDDVADKNDTVQNSVDDKFSWQFSPTKGITMWNGPQGTGDPDTDGNVVLRIGEQTINSTTRNILYLKGHIESQSGKIAEWNIISSGIYKDFSTTDGVVYRAKLQANKDSNADQAAFKIAKMNGNTEAEYPFYVRYNGEMHAEAGDIAGWKIKKHDATKQMLYNYFGDRTNGYTSGTGMAVSNVKTDPVFWAGFDSNYGAHPWEHTVNKPSTEKSWEDCCKFFVRNNGEMIARAGVIGPLTIQPIKNTNKYSLTFLKNIEGSTQTCFELNGDHGTMTFYQGNGITLDLNRHLLVNNARYNFSGHVGGSAFNEFWNNVPAINYSIGIAQQAYRTDEIEDLYENKGTISEPYYIYTTAHYLPDRLIIFQEKRHYLNGTLYQRRWGQLDLIKLITWKNAEQWKD